LYSWYIWLDLPTLEGVCGLDHFFDGVQCSIRRAALPVSIFVSLHFIEAGVLAYDRRVIHAFPVVA